MEVLKKYLMNIFVDKITGDNRGGGGGCGFESILLGYLIWLIYNVNISTTGWKSQVFIFFP